MIFLVSILSQAIHSALVIAMALIVSCAMRFFSVRLAGDTPSPFFQPLHDLRKSMRKQRLIAEGSSVLSGVGPVCAMACSMSALLLTPGFAVGMVSGPLSDTLVIAGLLLAGRIAMILTAMDAGSARGGIVAQQSMATQTMIAPVLLLLILPYALHGGTTNLDQLTVLQRGGALLPNGAGIFAAATVAVLLYVELIGDPADLESDRAGHALVMLQADAALRAMCWIDLAVTLCLPMGIVQMQDGWLEATGALLIWILKIACVVTGLLVVSSMAGAFRRAWLPVLLGFAGTAALIAVGLVLSSSGGLVVFRLGMTGAAADFAAMAVVLALALLPLRSLHTMTSLQAVQTGCVAMVLVLQTQWVSGLLHAVIQGVAMSYVLLRRPKGFVLAPHAKPRLGGFLIVALGGAIIMATLPFGASFASLSLVALGILQLATRRSDAGHLMALMQITNGIMLVEPVMLAWALPALGFLAHWRRTSCRRTSWHRASWHRSGI